VTESANFNGIMRNAKPVT